MMQNSSVTQRATAKTAASSWLQKAPSLLAGLIIFFSATKLALHFWPPSSLVYGIRVDYLAPSIYFLDILIALYLIVVRPRRTSSPLIPLLLTNLLFSANPLATLFWSLRLLLYLAFITSLKISPRTLAKTLLVAVVFQVFLGALQVFAGHSLGGIFTWLGESVVAVGSPGIATASLFGQTTLRAYGAFGHPNALAGWLVIALLMVLRLSPRAKQNIFFALLAAAGVLLTQSRSGMLALFGIVIPFFLIKTSKMRFLYYSITLLLLIPLSPTLLSPSRSDRSLAERRQLQNLSFSALKQYPIFGIGAQASIATYPSLPQPKPRGGGGQPDHNSFTLFLSWFGIFGVLTILSVLHSYSMPHTLYPILPIIPLLLLDHYLLTSPQGIFILILYLRVAISKPIVV